MRNLFAKFYEAISFTCARRSYMPCGEHFKRTAPFWTICETQTGTSLRTFLQNPVHGKRVSWKCAVFVRAAIFLDLHAWSERAALINGCSGSVTSCMWMYALLESVGGWPDPTRSACRRQWSLGHAFVRKNIIFTPTDSSLPGKICSNS